LFIFYLVYLVEELGKIGLAYIRQGQFEINVNTCNIIREISNDIKTQNTFSDVNVKIFLIFYCEMKLEWGNESYTDKCTRKERMGIRVIWMKAGIWILRGIRRGFERGSCPLYLGEEDAKHLLLKCSETKKGREECANCNWLNINEDLAYRKLISCTNVNKIKSVAKYLFMTKCKWENKVGGGHNRPPRVIGSQNID
jgi:hypothetical protein